MNISIEKIMQNTKNVNGVQTLLRLTYGLVAIVAGADKFTSLLTDWEKFLNPALKRLLPFDGHIFMMIVGCIEIIAGIIVLAKPQLGAWIVSAWLLLIALTLIGSLNNLDIAVRDIVMAIGAYSLAKLSSSNQLKSA